MFENCLSWPPVKVSRFRSLLSYIENPWALGHISKCEGGTGGSIAPFLRGAMMHPMNFRTSKQNFYCSSWGGGSLYGSVDASRDVPRQARALAPRRRHADNLVKCFNSSAVGDGA